MAQSSKYRVGLEYICVCALAVALIAVIAYFNNVAPVVWDGGWYVRMARAGKWWGCNDQLIAPFAYRWGMPLVVHYVSKIPGVSLEQGFRLTGMAAGFCLLVATFGLSRRITGDFAQSLIVTLVVAFSMAHLKFPLFFYSMVDISAYPLMVLACWSLLGQRYLTCLGISALGLLFKEFLAIPWLLLLMQLGWLGFSSTQSECRRKYCLMFVLGVLAGVAAIGLPRLVIPVSGTGQEIDPLNNPATLSRLWENPMNIRRHINICFAFLSYWLPTLMLLTGPRMKSLWRELDSWRIFVAVYLVLIWFLTMYGGISIPIFVSYAIGAQIVVLSVVLRQKVPWWELIYMLTAMVIFNKLWLEFPMPTQDMNAYLDFYAGCDTRVNASTLIRLAEIIMFIVLGQCFRYIMHCFSDQKADVPEKKVA